MGTRFIGRRGIKKNNNKEEKKRREESGTGGRGSRRGRKATITTKCMDMYLNTWEKKRQKNQGKTTLHLL